MALDITSLEDTLRTWVAGVSGIEVIFAYPSRPRPIVPYALINIYQNTPVGIAEFIGELQVDNSVDLDHSNTEEIAVSINTYYSNAYRNATLIKDSLARITVIEQLYAGGLGYSRAAIVQKIPEIVDLNYEERAQFDCFFYARSLDEENIETIRSIELTNEIDDSTTTITKP